MLSVFMLGVVNEPFMLNVIMRVVTLNAECHGATWS
jgi:hypothetical protein